MLSIDVHNINGEKVDTITLEEELFNVPAKSDILHSVVTMQLTNKRSGSAKVKNRSDIRGSGKKLYRQKGTGNSRPGDIKSPLRRGGGVVFGPKVKKYNYKVPKRIKKMALQMAISGKISDEKLLVLDAFEMPEIKTKTFVDIIDRLNVESALIVIDSENLNLDLSSRNCPYVKLIHTKGLNVYDILNYKHLIVLQQAIEQIKDRVRQN
ncbi:Ribosomal protein L4/L1e, bacterial-type [Candidatus Magnetomorum sp. HK-1]|nr:Ribosomal protein L4/L1e, bacterial-type [Candidatus Magnetomorum sp. HK-1]